MTDSEKTTTEENSAEPGTGHAPEVPRKATLRPPDWTAPGSVSSLALERLTQGRAISRRAGNRAELASLRARILDARRRADTEAERNLSATLARKLVARGSGLAEATKLARRSLLMGEDPELREELSNWFAGLGEVALAAGTLEPLLERVHDDAGRAAIWTRVAVLRGRAGDVARTAKALLSAAEADRSDPVSLELFGALRTIAGSGLLAGRAARALLEAAQRRKVKNDARGAFDDLLQAFDAEPSYLPSTERLADELFQAGRFQAADEVWRIAAEYHTDSGSLHQRRLRDALGAGDLSLALGAALDAGADKELDLDGIRTGVSLVNDGAGTVPVPNFDGLLAPAGLLPWLSARLEVAALQKADSRLMLTLARLTAGPIGNPRLAAAHIADALVFAPDNEEAERALQEYASSTGDYSTEIDCCIRIAQSKNVSMKDRAKRLVDLAHIVEQQSKDPGGALWALSCLRELNEVPEELRELEQRLQRRETVAPRFEDWSRLSLAELRRALDYLAERPPAAEQYVQALFEMRRRDPESMRWRLLLERVFWREGMTEQLESFWWDELASARGDQSAARAGLCRLYLRRQEPDRALALLRDAAHHSLGIEDSALLSVVASLFGKPEDRALGLQKLADHARAPVRAILLSVASRVLHSDHHREKALRLAEEACHSAPSAARPIVCYAEAAVGEKNRVAALAFQRACEVSVPRVHWCRSLADAAVDGQQIVEALRRWLTLAPFDLEASKRLLARLVEQQDAERAAKALDWLLGQPLELKDAAEEIARTLEFLTKQTPIVAKSLAQRMLGVFGAKDERLSEVIATTAVQLEEPWLQVALIERRLATGQPDHAEAHELYWELAELRAELGQTDLAYEALHAALRVGADADRILERLPSVGEPGTSDGVLHQLAGWALALAKQGKDAVSAAHAYREYGAALWDLAGDSESAVVAWQHAADLDVEQGDERLARDLIAFCGYQAALPELFELAKQRPPARAASLLLAGAALALSDGFKPEAVQLAGKGLELEPARTEGLAILERAVALENQDILARAYERVSTSLLGVYGERALHYRAARQFERRRAHDVAFEHAVQAFEAVPAEGVAFALMLRLAALVGKQDEAARAIERVAQAAVDPEQRAKWLESAARAAGPGPEGTRLRVEVLLRALLVRPEVESLESLGKAFEELFREHPEERLKQQSKFDSSVRTLLRRLDDRESAEVAVVAGLVAADAFGSAGLAAGALRRALQLDPDCAAFEKSPSFFPLFSKKPGSIRPFLDELAEACSGDALPHRALLELGVSLAERVASDLLPQFAVAAARKDPSDLAAVSRAEQLAAEHPKLLEQLRGVLDLSDRAAELLQHARKLYQTEPERAAKLLRDVLKRSDPSEAAYEEVFRELEEIYTLRQQTSLLEDLYKSALETERQSVERRTEAARRLSHLLTERGAHTAALEVLLMIDRLGEMAQSDLEQAIAIARDTEDWKREAELLERLLPRLPNEREKLPVYRRLLELSESLGQKKRAVEFAGAVLRIEPGDQDAEQLLLKDSDQREDWAAYVEVAERRLERASKPEEKEVLQLADVLLHQRKQPEAAVELLQRYHRKLPQSLTILERLAESYVASGDTSAAAETYQRASKAARDSQEAARFAELSARKFLESGAVSLAARVVGSDSIYPKTPALAELRVEVAQKQGDHEARANALEELAFVSMEPAAVRAEYLRSAAEIALEAGQPEVALKRAQRAARIAPTDPRAQVFARLLEYKSRGTGNAEEALTTITELRSLGSVSDPRLAQIRSYLLAQALARRAGAEAALQELKEAERTLGGGTLIALGLAERLALRGPKQQVVEYYRRALEGGEVGVIRPVLEVALEAAEYAEKNGMPQAALEFVQPFAESSSRARKFVARLETAREKSRTRLDLPRLRPRSSPTPEARESVPAGGEDSAPLTTIESPAESLRLSLAQGTPLPRGGTRQTQSGSVPSAPQRGSGESSGARPAPAQAPPRDAVFHAKPAETASKPASAVTRIGLPSAATLVERSASAPVRPPPKPRSSPTASAEPPSRTYVTDVMTTAPTDPAPRQQAGEGSTSASTFPAPPARARLDRTVEVPSFSTPPSKPVQVTVKADPRTLAQTLSSFSAKPKESPPSRSSDALRSPTSSGNPPVSVASSSVVVPSRRGEPAPAFPATPRGPTEGSVSSPPSSSFLERPVRPSLSVHAASATESQLIDALQAGDTLAGAQLVTMLQGKPGRSHDLVKVCRILLDAQPGSQALTQQLLDAATRDRDYVYASALNHALHSLTAPEKAPAAPALQQQDVQPEAIVRLLIGPELPPSLEVLQLLFLGVPHLFRTRPPLEGTTQVSTEGLEPLPQLMNACLRAFGVHRTLLYVAAELDASPRFHSFVTDPLVLLVQGAGNPLSPEYRHRFGAAVFGCRPELCLATSLPQERLKIVFEAVMAAFGPPRQMSGDVARVAQLAERLWESLPARSQRRVQELCEQHPGMDANGARTEALGIGQRAGLFVSADLATAVRDVAQWRGIALPDRLGPETLEQLCRAHDLIARLVQFATSLEYAEARWRQPRTQSSMMGRV